MTDRITYGAHSYGEIHAIGRLGQIRVGKFCSIAGSVTAVMDGHHTDWISTYPFSDRRMHRRWSEASAISGHPHCKGSIDIGNDVWIGQGVTLIAGTNIGHGAVVAAGAVVAKDVPPYTIAAGNPAKVVKLRFDYAKTEAMLKIAWWHWPENKIRENLPLICSGKIEEFIKRHLK